MQRACSTSITPAVQSSPLYSERLDMNTPGSMAWSQGISPCRACPLAFHLHDGHDTSLDIVECNQASSSEVQLLIWGAVA